MFDTTTAATSDVGGDGLAGTNGERAHHRAAGSAGSGVGLVAEAARAAGATTAATAVMVIAADPPPVWAPIVV